MNKPNLLYQFKITLKEIEPAIWRRIQVPSKYSFWDLHVAIQDAMGWFDCHLHSFRLKKPHGRKILEIGIPIENDFVDIVILPGWDEDLADYFPEPGKIIEYEYDFGDGWQHEILFEGILLKEKNVKYPQCIAGERACPPEDCGGEWGYHSLLDVLRGPHNTAYEDVVEWYGKYDPERFEAEKVKFDNPSTRLKNLL